ncbi:hypothetical protein FRC08_005583 [Ceratobasidium sp. 394]|nr:hypothetical protein FRC08_005583 [Ceratobasidium sp. 394]KAG9093823.1 hypothetical protein FS749_013670 [Ceratobasidium sp. UAMH 11750]
MVRTLFIYGRPDDYYSPQYDFPDLDEVENLKKLILLPNLRSIIIRRAGILPCTAVQKILSVFFRPSCTSISLHGAFGALPGEYDIDLSQALSSLWGGDSNLEKIQLCVRQTDKTDWFTLAAGLATMLSLRVLELAQASLDDSILDAARQLPHLQRLTVFNNLTVSRSEFKLGLFDGSINAFSALTHLELLGNWTIGTLASIIHHPLAIAHIESMHLCGRARTGEDWEILFNGLRKHAHSLQRAKFEFLDNYLLTAQTLSPLFDIPLAQLSLIGVYFSGDHQFDRLLQSCRRLRLSLAHLTMPLEIVSAQDLLQLAKFPSLRMVHIYLDFGSAIPPLPEAPGPISDEKLFLESSFELAGATNELLEEWARLFLYCWNDVQLTKSVADQDVDEAVEDEPDAKRFRYLVQKVEETKRRLCR